MTVAKRSPQFISMLTLDATCIVQPKNYKQKGHNYFYILKDKDLLVFSLIDGKRSNQSILEFVNDRMNEEELLSILSKFRAAKIIC